MSIVTIRTNFTPPISFDPFEKGKAGALIDFLKPSIDGELPVVGHVHYAPHGEPSSAGALLLIAVVSLAVYGAYELLR